MEYRRDNYVISDEPSRLDMDTICDFLSRAYWANRRTRSTIERSIKHSLNFGMFDGAKQIGFTRVVSDHAVFAYICDVFIHEDYRGRGLGKWMIESILSHPELQGLRRWSLVTRDAHAFYRQYGFAELSDPSRWMERFDPTT